MKASDISINTCLTKVKDLHIAGDTATALNLAYSMLEQSDISLCQPVVVNLFIAKVSDPYKVANGSHAVGCLEFVNKIREAVLSPEWDAAVKVIEDQAIDMLNELCRMDEEVIAARRASAAALEDGHDDDQPKSTQQENDLQDSNGWKQREEASFRPV